VRAFSSVFGIGCWCWLTGGCGVDGANIEIAEEVGESNVCTWISIYLFFRGEWLTTYGLVFFGHLTPAVEDLRYQHLYHPVDVHERCPALANVLDKVSEGAFGDGAVYEP
jgi:starch phosphorylase